MATPTFKTVITEDGDAELFADGKFLVSWDARAMKMALSTSTHFPEFMVQRMCECAYEQGERDRSKEILKLLGGGR